TVGPRTVVARRGLALLEHPGRPESARHPRVRRGMDRRRRGLHRPRPEDLQPPPLRSGGQGQAATAARADLSGERRDREEPADRLIAVELWRRTLADYLLPSPPYPASRPFDSTLSQEEAVTPAGYGSCLIRGCAIASATAPLQAPGWGVSAAGTV